MLTVNIEQQVTFLILSTSENLFAQFLRVSDVCITVLEVVKVDLFFWACPFFGKRACEYTTLSSHKKRLRTNLRDTNTVPKSPSQDLSNDM